MPYIDVVTQIRAWVSSVLAGYVPYTGATGNVNLGANGLTASTVTATTDYLGSPATGDIGYDADTKTHRACDLLVNGALRKVLNCATANGNTIATTNETALYASAISIPANGVSAGRFLEVNWWGTLTTDAATPGTVTIRIKFGSTTVATITTPTLTTSLSSAVVHITARITFSDVDASGDCRGIATCSIFNNTLGTSQVEAVVVSGSTIDWTAAEDLSATWQFSSLGGSSGNTFTATGRAAVC